MSQHFYNYSDSPFDTSQGTPADHSTYGQRTGDFDVITAPDGTWDVASDGGNCVEFVGSGLNSTPTWLIYDANRGQTIADEGPDIEVVARNFRGSDGTSGIADWRIILRAHTGTDADDSDNLYEVGLREAGGGALNANIQKRESGSNSTLLDTEVGADHDTAWPVDTESWIRARAWDDGGTVQLKIKFWTGSAADEPASWTGETTDSTFHGVSGYHGHMVVRGEHNFDAVGVGTGGDSAPTEPVSGGGTTFTQSVTGTTTPSGSLTRKTKKPISGSVTMTGRVFKKIFAGLAGSITASGALTSRVVIKQAISGATTPTGSLTRKIGKAVSGSIKPAGAITRKVRKALAGAVTVSGAIFRKTATALSGSITASGSLITKYTTTQSVSGSTTPSGSLSQKIVQITQAVGKARTHLKNWIGL